MLKDLVRNLQRDAQRRVDDCSWCVCVCEGCSSFYAADLFLINVFFPLIFNRINIDNHGVFTQYCHRQATIRAIHFESWVRDVMLVALEFQLTATTILPTTISLDNNNYSDNMRMSGTHEWHDPHHCWLCREYGKWTLMSDWMMQRHERNKTTFHL